MEAIPCEIKFGGGGLDRPGALASDSGACSSVYILLAFLLIRRLASKTQRVGPILALSYKNRAIDEFLVDLLEAGKSPGGGAAETPPISAHLHIISGWSFGTEIGARLFGFFLG